MSSPSRLGTTGAVRPQAQRFSCLTPRCSRPAAPAASLRPPRSAELDSLGGTQKRNRGFSRASASSHCYRELACQPHRFFLLVAKPSIRHRLPSVRPVRRPCVAQLREANAFPLPFTESRRSSSVPFSNQHLRRAVALCAHSAPLVTKSHCAIVLRLAKPLERASRTR